MSDAGPSRQSVPNVAPHLKQFAEATNLSIDEARVKLAEITKSRQPPLPPPPPASAQSVDESEAVTAQMQQMSHHGIDSVEADNRNIRNELNELENNGKMVQFLYEILTVVVNRNFPECQGLNEAWEFYESNGRLPPSLADTLNPSPFHMGSIAGALPAPQSNITPMGQNMMPQQQQQQQQQQMVPQQHQMMQRFSNPPIVQQQIPHQQQQEQALQFSQLPHGMNPSPMGYAPNQYNMLMPAGQPQPQQQHPMMQQMQQTVSNPPMIQQQYAYQQPQQLPIQLPYAVNDPQMGYAFNPSNMQVPFGQPQPQPQQAMYGPAMMPYMGQGGMPPHYQ
ncbi:hypothetical protein KC318_g2997 [Hortaea werneckii]|nr:hypothetical protein KC334_g3707 [Hortaea werneckii]KAI7018904.1 hypothetical protein KC355_g3197 [Hortaea werneckii]KAI7672224.1 hypothetical protein KC318_g2997 [Hortaea werneckii]